MFLKRLLLSGMPWICRTTKEEPSPGERSLRQLLPRGMRFTAQERESPQRSRTGQQDSYGAPNCFVDRIFTRLNQNQMHLGIARGKPLHLEKFASLGCESVLSWQNLIQSIVSVVTLLDKHILPLGLQLPLFGMPDRLSKKKKSSTTYA